MKNVKSPTLIYNYITFLLGEIHNTIIVYFFFKRFYVFLERGEGRERNIDVQSPLVSPHPPGNPGKCLDWE